jgi:hypothetical protein
VLDPPDEVEQLLLGEDPGGVLDQDLQEPEGLGTEPDLAVGTEQAARCGIENEQGETDFHSARYLGVRGAPVIPLGERETPPVTFEGALRRRHRD